MNQDTTSTPNIVKGFVDRLRYDLFTRNTHQINRQSVNLEIDLISYEVRSCPWKVTVLGAEAHKALQRTNLEVHSQTLEQLAK